jgi:proteasome lid subunit RPN8/RPN11
LESLKAQQQNIGTSGVFKGPNGQKKAAITALDAIYGKSNKEHTEYGGRIYMRADGTYGFTTPVKGGRDANGTPSVDVDAGGAEGSRIPAGTTNVGIYHTHPEISGYSGERFSGNDAIIAVREHIPNFMEAPSRSIYEVDGTHSNNYFTAPQTVLRDGP